MTQNTGLKKINVNININVNIFVHSLFVIVFVLCNIGLPNRVVVTQRAEVGTLGNCILRGGEDHLLVVCRLNRGTSATKGGYSPHLNILHIYPIYT